MLAAESPLLVIVTAPMMLPASHLNVVVVTNRTPGNCGCVVADVIIVNTIDNTPTKANTESILFFIFPPSIQLFTIAMFPLTQLIRHQPEALTQIHPPSA